MSGDKKKDAPIGALIMLSVAMPGAGQLALGQTRKGIIIIVISAILCVYIMAYAFIIIAPIAGAMMAGIQPVIDKGVVEPLVFLLKILAVSVAIWVWALIDTIQTARRRDSKKLNA
ncbi:hypothetical protein MNBD_NITROSPINAE04-1426 [hydrothermal vent metagenome]|uniref:Uncharacterized protein n=1 Tax=hydrothermal vent metagenome TaxID=652676 RepID=A0A3B1CMK8_9ZZZZ